MDEDEGRSLIEGAAASGRSFSNAAQVLALSYSREHGGGLDQMRVFALRDSVDYRGGAVVWHLKVLASHYYELGQKLQQTWPESFGDPIRIRQERVGLSYLLDDLVFNLMSLYDYFAKFLSLVCLGENGKSYPKWKSLVGVAKGKDGRLSKMSIASVLAEIDRDWVGALWTYRSTTIHNQMSPAGASHELDLDALPEGARLVATIPDSLVGKMRFLQPLQRDGKVDLVEGAAAMVQKAFESGQILVAAAQRTH